MDSEHELRDWLRDLDRRVTRLETRGEEARLRQSNITIKMGIAISAITAVAVWVLNLAAGWLGW